MSFRFVIGNVLHRSSISIHDINIKVAVPFNFGGPQPESVFPLPEDAELSLITSAAEAGSRLAICGSQRVTGFFLGSLSEASRRGG